MNHGLLRLLVLGALAGAAIWVLAGIGLVTVATSIGTSEAEPEGIGQPLIPRSDVTGLDIHDLPRHPDASRIDYRFDAFARLTLTEIGYVTDASASRVAAWHLETLDLNGWDVVEAAWRDGVWTADVEKDERQAAIRVAPSTAGTEIELRVIETPIPRGDPPAR